MSKRLTYIDKATHSKEVADCLKDKGNCNDWVITIVFYAALHYTNHIIFPYEDTQKTYYEFEKLYHDKKNIREGRHGFTKRFLTQNSYSFASEYAILNDLSVTSRYTKRQMCNNQVDMSYKCLDAIIKEIA